MSEFKSKVGWPTQASNLPTYQGGNPGRAAIRKAEMEAGGMGGIRRVDWTDERGNHYTLNTRNGMPEVVREIAAGHPTPPLTVSRGWLARANAAATAALFSPYSLVVATSDFKPPSTGYSVLPFSTTYNAAAPDSLHWGDVISFSTSGLLINGKPMPLLGISGNVPTGGAMPWLIPAGGTDIEKYGDDATNATVKRVFSITRVSVHSWAGADAMLTGATYRGEDKAAVCGPRIDATTNKAWLSQIEFTGYSWDDINGGWGFTEAEVTMLLTAPFLTSVDGGPSVDQASCTPAFTGAPSGAATTSASLPDTEVALIGTGEVHPTEAPGAVVGIWWPWSGVFKASLQGQSSVAYSGPEYDGRYAISGNVAGRSYSISAENRKTFRDNSESLTWLEQSVDLPPYNSNTPGDLMGEMREGGAFYWSNPAAPNGPIGNSFFYTYAGSTGKTGTFKTEDQSGNFSISVGDVRLVEVSFSRFKSAGTRVSAHGTDGRFSIHLANPTGQIGANDGFGQWSNMSLFADSSAGWLANNYGRQAELESLLFAKASEMASVQIYDCQMLTQSSGELYTATLDSGSSDDQTLRWITKDFILFDEPNKVFISVEATCSGTQRAGGVGLATLVVTLKVSTPSGDAEQLLHKRDMTYGEMLEEQLLQSGVWYVPSPRLRLMFAPLHQGQGGFSGAAYTEASEVAGGAVPAYLFNFVLGLGTYDDIGPDLSASTQVRFIPFNLLEMLYGYVFSTKYGVDDYQRYPVEFTNRYTSIMETLFSTQWRVNYRDGAFVDWLDTLGGTYVTETTTGLYRI